MAMRSRQRGPKASRTPNVTLDLVHRVEALLEREQAPMTRYALLQRLREDRHGTTRPRLNAAVEHLARHHIVYDGGEDGIVWLGSPSLKVLEGLARAKVLR
jgi:hypothetical protein